MDRILSQSHRKKPEFWGSIQVGGEPDQPSILGYKAIDDLISESRTFTHIIFPNLAADARRISEEVFSGRYRPGIRDRKFRSAEQTLAPVTLSIENLLGALRSMRIVVPDPAAVRDYLLHHEDLVDFLICTCEIVSDRLGEVSQLSLELYEDPEIEDRHLTLYARHERYEQHLLDTIDAVSAEFEGELAGKSGWFLLTTDFGPPR